MHLEIYSNEIELKYVMQFIPNIVCGNFNLD